MCIDLNVRGKTIVFYKETQKKIFKSWGRQRFLSYDNKIIVHKRRKRKKSISPEIKTFALQKKTTNQYPLCTQIQKS